MKTYRLLLLICLLTSLPCFALDPTDRLTQYKTETWNDENGLPQNSVWSVLQTMDGYLWFGTEEGLARFDGVRFTRFHKDNTPGIEQNSIFTLYEDSRGRLWIGTKGGGVTLQEEGRFRHYGPEEGLNEGFVYSICEDAAGKIWVGTEKGKLFYLHGESFVLFKSESLPRETVSSLYKDSRGRLWIGLVDGIFYLEDSRITGLPEKYQLSDIHINSMCEDRDNRLWLGTDTGLFKWIGDHFTHVPMKTTTRECKINSLYIDGSGDLWIGTVHSGLIRYHEGGFSSFSAKDGLADNTIISVTGDHEGSLWVGTALGGVQRLSDTRLKTFGVKEGLSDEIVFSVFQDSRGYLWIGTNNGLNRLDGDKITHFTTRDGLSHDTVSTITEDSRGYIWVATDAGLNRLGYDKKRIFKIKDYLLENIVLAVQEDRTGTLWAGVLGGLMKKDPRVKEGFVKIKGLPSKVINFVFQDREDNLWLSTLRAGLTRYREGEVTRFDTKKGLISDSLNCIYEDDTGVFWIGSNKGLSRFKDGVFTNYSRNDGLYNDNIYQVLEDNGGCLWMSCNKGIFKVKKQELEEFAAGKIDKIHSHHYGKGDGMRSSECNGGFQGAGCKTKEGKLWFPTMKGAVVIDPENIPENPAPPPVHIEAVLLDGVAAGRAGQVRVKPGIKRVEFKYTALSFLDPEKVLFKYRLEGYEGDWVEGGNRRRVSYTNLDAGEYRFLVTACNNDGLWNEKKAALSLKVIAPFWKTWWFTLAALVVFALLSHLFIQLARHYITLTQFWKKQKYIGKFKILDKIGEGGMGTIYKASNYLEKSAPVAVKVLKDELFKDENSRKRFKQEAAIIDQLDHPNIVKVLERGQSRDNMFIAMEYLEGKTLKDKINEEGKIDLIDAVNILVQAGDALARIHSKNIVHRDLKPENIMLVKRQGDDNYVKLLDFGLARTQTQTRLTQTGMVIGTLNYMAPEQIAGSEFSEASDVYSLGVIFYETLTGEQPFLGETTVDVMRQILDKTPLAPIRFRLEISLELNDLVMEMLNKDNAERPDIRQVLERLKQIQAQHHPARVTP